MNNCYDSTEQVFKVFVNCVNLYHGKVLSQYLAENFGKNAGNTRNIKIVGTMNFEKSGPPSPYADIIFFKDTCELYEQVKNCDVIVYDVTETHSQVEEAKAIIKCLTCEQGDIKCCMFILVSTIGTWAMTGCIDELDPEMPLTEEDFRSRKPHPNFVDHLQVEKMAVKLRKIRENFMSCVIVSGLTYGQEENIFNFIFKAAWLNECTVPLYGNGENVLPMIHICDLAKIILKVIESKPKKWYILAVDNSHSTYRQISEAVTKSFSTRELKEYPHVDAYLNEDLTQTQIDLLGVDLKMENFLKEIHGIELDYPDGMVENLPEVIKSYRECRNLPIPQIIVLGPPCSGKSFISCQLSKTFNTPVLNADSLRTDAITEIMKKFSFYPEPICSEENELKKDNEELCKLFEEMRISTKEGNGVGDDLLVKIMQEIISSKMCNLHGFIIDGFPETPDQAQKLFPESTDRLESSQQSLPNSVEVQNRWLFNLAPSDYYYQDCVLNLPEKAYQECKMTTELLVKRMVEYKSSGHPKLVLDHLEKCLFRIIDVDFCCMDSEGLSKIVQSLPLMNREILETRKSIDVGCHPEFLSNKEIDIDCLDREEKLNEAQLQSSRMQSKSMREIEEEKYCLEISSCDYYKYLCERVLLKCADGINECLANEPKDPVEFLAKYIFGVSDGDQDQ